MKKFLIVAMLFISMAAFARSSGMSNSGMMQQSGGDMGSGMIQQNINAENGMMQQQSNMNTETEMVGSFNGLNREQQIQFQQMQLKYQNELQKDAITINEIGLEIEKEMMAEKVDTQKIDKLIDKKAAVYSKMEKNMIEYRIKVKEKFGIEVANEMMIGNSFQMMNGMNQTAGDMGQVMNSINQMINNMNRMMNEMDQVINNMNQMQNEDKMPEYQK